MNKHTPGPWIFEHRNGDHPLNDQDGWGCEGLWAVNGGFILGSGAGWDGAYQAPTEANARLIAAAPEMLEILQELQVAEEYGYEANVLLRIRLNKLATRAVALLAKIAGNE